MIVNCDNLYLDRVDHTRFLRPLHYISNGILEVDSQTGELVTCLTDQVPEQIIIEGEQHIQAQTKVHVSLSIPNRSLAAHSCSYPDLDLIGMCEDNYKELDRVYLLNKIIEAVTPSGAPTS